jgi:hypothetical protein
MGLFQTSSKTEATGVFLWLVSPHLKYQITPSHSRPRHFHHHQLSDEEQPRWAYSRHPGMTCDLGLCLLCFVSPLPEI